MYNTKDMLVFNPALDLPEQLPPPGRLAAFIATGDILALVDSDGNVFDAAQGRTNAVGAMDTTATIDLANGTYVTATLAANTAISITNPPSQGGSFSLLLTNGGAFTPTWPASVLWAGGVEPVWTVAGVDYVQFVTFDGGVSWVGTAVSLDVQ